MGQVIAFDYAGSGDGSGDGSGYGYGDGDGSGYGDGSGDGSGYGYGYGDGYGSGYGSGSGYGDGSGSGSGYGDGDGSGYGDGDGSGYGDGDGSGSGSGYGYGDGSGYGYGYGDGDGDKDEANSATYYAALLGNAEPRKDAVMSIWRSTKEGFPANNGSLPKPAQVGDIHETKGPLRLCGPGTLHATFNPPKWKGDRWWIVALYGEIAMEGDKVGALKREIVAEIV